MELKLLNDLRKRLQNLSFWVSKRHHGKDGFDDIYDAGYYACLKQVIAMIDEMEESPIYNNL